MKEAAEAVPDNPAELQPISRRMRVHAGLLAVEASFDAVEQIKESFWGDAEKIPINVVNFKKGYGGGHVINRSAIPQKNKTLFDPKIYDTFFWAISLRYSRPAGH